MRHSKDSQPKCLSSPEGFLTKVQTPVRCDLKVRVPFLMQTLQFFLMSWQHWMCSSCFVCHWLFHLQSWPLKISTRKGRVVPAPLMIMSSSSSESQSPSGWCDTVSIYIYIFKKIFFFDKILYIFFCCTSFDSFITPHKNLWTSQRFCSWSSCSVFGLPT